MVVVPIVAYALLITLLVLAVVCLLKGKWKLLLVAIVVWMLASLSIANHLVELFIDAEEDSAAVQP